MATMQYRQTLCNSCGVKIEVGRANCPVCGARAGTLFSEAAIASAPKVDRRPSPPPLSANDNIEKARESANHSVILSLLALFPVLGFFLGPFSIYIAVRASKTLRSYQVEDGRGVAAAGIVIGSLAILAQISYVMLLLGSNQSATSLLGL